MAYRSRPVRHRLAGREGRSQWRSTASRSQRYTQSVEVALRAADARPGAVTLGAAQMAIAVLEIDGDAVASSSPACVMHRRRLGHVQHRPAPGGDRPRAHQGELSSGRTTPMRPLASRATSEAASGREGFTVDVRNPSDRRVARCSATSSEPAASCIDDPSTRPSSPTGRIEVRITGDRAFDPSFGQASVFASAEVRGVIWTHDRSPDHRDARPGQALRRRAGRGRHRPGGRAGRDLRPGRPERRRQDHHHAILATLLAPTAGEAFVTRHPGRRRPGRGAPPHRLHARLLRRLRRPAGVGVPRLLRALLRRAGGAPRQR